MSSPTIDSLPTPAMVVNVPQVKRNIAKLNDYTREHGITFRPHTKTHKTKFFAKMQIDGGAKGLTVAKVGEGEVMAEVCDDLFLAYPALDAGRTGRIAELAKSVTMRVGVDSKLAVDRIAEAARAAGSTVGLLADLDVGMHRTGVQSPEAFVELSKYIDSTKGVRYDGMMTYPGHVIGSKREDEIKQLKEIDAYMKAALDQLKTAGLKAQIVTGGSTPTQFISHHVTSLTEIRPGTSVFNDANCWLGGYCALEECAARIIVTVVSDAVPNQCVIDSGSKTLTSDRYFKDPDNAGFGRIVGYPDARIVKLSEEHGQVDISKCDKRPKLGDRLEVIPNHICPCVNLQTRMWLQDNGSLRQISVDARGMLS